MSTQGIRGLYRGFWATMWRDTPGWGVYFAAYEWMKGINLNKYCPVSDNHKPLRDFIWILNAGGCAGVASWVVSMPQDIIKSK